MLEDLLAQGFSRLCAAAQVLQNLPVMQPFDKHRLSAAG
jgi:hypothetical protein